MTPGQKCADLTGVALLAPLMRALLEQTPADKDDKELQLAIGSCSDSLLKWIACGVGKKQGGVAGHKKDEVTGQGFLCSLSGQ